MSLDIEIKGHSGCQVRVVQEGDGLYVLKSTTDVSYLKRLLRQADKQQKASLVEHQHIRVPKIYTVNSDESSASIKMQYVYSRNFIEFMEQAGFEQVEYLVDALKNFLEYEIRQSPVSEVPSRLFQEKFSDIKRKAEKNDLLQSEDFHEILEKAEWHFANLSSCLTLPMGLCHGDLTFSNILFNGNNYYLIDFLDNFIETPLQDIVKLRQDTAFRWSQLMYTKRFDAVRLHIVCDKIDREIDSYFRENYKWYCDYYQTMQLMNILRILPYVHEKRVADYLRNVLQSILRNEREQKESIVEKATKSTTVAKSHRASLLIPAAADKQEYKDGLPYVFSLDKDGFSPCVKSILGLDYRQFNQIYVAILKKHNEKFAVHELLKPQFKRLGVTNAKIVILDTPTRDQAETVYETIRQENICGSIFIKDADSYFKISELLANGIAIYPIEELPVLIPQDKSYVAVDDMAYVTNIIEKSIVGHYISAGGYAFDESVDFCNYYLKLRRYGKLYLSHILYSMLLNKKTFRPIEVQDYQDWGTANAWHKENEMR